MITGPSAQEIERLRAIIKSEAVVPKSVELPPPSFNFADVNDHYWVIDESETEVYQSKTNTIVSVTNQDFIDWQQNVCPSATPIGSIAELSAVLKQRGSSLPDWLLNTQPSFIQPTSSTYSNSQLIAYDANARWIKEQGGYKTSWGMLIETNDRSQAKVNGCRIAADTSNQYTTKWYSADGTIWNLTNTQCKALANELQLHINKCFIISADDVSKIGLGTMTTLAQIDAAYAAYNPMAGGPPALLEAD